jgi:hypothetical protein
MCARLRAYACAGMSLTQNNTNMYAYFENMYAYFENMYAYFENVYAYFENVYAYFENVYAYFEIMYAYFENMKIPVLSATWRSVTCASLWC